MKTLVTASALLLSAYLLYAFVYSLQTKHNPVTNELRLNQIQILGTHNSYRLRTNEKVLEYLMANKDQLPEGFDPIEWDYSSPPLDKQLNEFGIRSLEFDLYYDPSGGLFSRPKAELLWNSYTSTYFPGLDEPGMKVLHYPDFDYNTTFPDFRSALLAVKHWSDKQRNHVPLIIILETKEDGPASLLGPSFTKPIRFDSAALSEIEREIKQVFSPIENRVISPDNIRGNYPTLNKAVLAKNWPTLDSAKGKIIFVLMASKETNRILSANHPSLKGSLLFTFSDPGNPECAFINYDDPLKYFNHIKALVKAGYIVRTRSDADTYEARKGDYRRMKKAFSSGAHIISTDYCTPDYRSKVDTAWSEYFVQLPGRKEAIRNPITGN